MTNGLGLRRWIAWRLVRLAERIFTSSYEEELIIVDTTTDQEVMRVGVFGDYYGSGVSSIFNELPEHLKLIWTEDGEEVPIKPNNDDIEKETQ